MEKDRIETPRRKLTASVPKITRRIYGEEAGNREMRRVYDWCEKGLIPAFKWNNLWHVDDDELDAFIDAQRTAAANPRTT